MTWLVEENSFWIFVLLTLVVGGGAGWMTGRAVALTWRPVWKLVWFMVLLTAAVRFLHFALFDGTLLSPYYYCVDFLCIGAIALIGYRFTRTGQMVEQYNWLYERVGPLSWRLKPGRSDAV